MNRYPRVTLGEWAYPDTPRVSYDFGADIGKAIFVPVCERCARFIKAPDPLVTSAKNLQAMAPEPFATCSKCGPTTMPFEGFF